MTEQMQILQRHWECISRDLKVLSVKVFLMYLREKRRWIPCFSVFSWSKMILHWPNTLAQSLRAQAQYTFAMWTSLQDFSAKDGYYFVTPLAKHYTFFLVILYHFAFHYGRSKLFRCISYFLYLFWISSTAAGPSILFLCEVQDSQKQNLPKNKTWRLVRNASEFLTLGQNFLETDEFWGAIL